MTRRHFEDLSMANLDERRRRCLDLRRSQIDDKLKKLETLKQELQTLKSGNNHEIEESQIVVALPVTPGRKSARKMVKDPMAVSLGRKEASVLARVEEMQRSGVWAGKKIQKVIEFSVNNQ